MAKSELLFCPSGHAADDCTAEMRRHGFGIHPCHHFMSAVEVLETRPVIAILIMSTARSREIDSLLAYRLQNHQILPVFFMAMTDFPNLKRVLEHPGVLLLPARPSPVELERLLISVGAYTTPPWKRFKSGIPKNLVITVRRQEFPIKFQDARKQFEIAYLERVLRIFHGNVTRTAEAIQMGRRNLQVKIKKHKVDLAAIRREFESY